MASGDPGKAGGGVLGYFGLETGEKTLEVLAWATPYLLILLAGLAGISFLVHGLLALPTWVYVLAGVLASVYFFLFMARMRKLALDASQGEDTPGSQ